MARPICCTARQLPEEGRSQSARTCCKVANHYLYLNDLEYIKKKTGRVVGIMHSLPRNDFEFEQSLDKSEFELYFKQIGFSIPLRMALLASICGVN
ncbi:MAG: hypothetical protein ACLR7Z_00065 [Bilophila wadsworthia]